jgi:serine/threonine protein kinase
MFIEVTIAILVVLIIGGIVALDIRRKQPRSTDSRPLPPSAPTDPDTQPTPAMKPASPATLRLLGEDGYQEVGLATDPFTIGRLRQSSLVLSHESVSRRHAELRREEDHWYLIDVGSSNGVFVNSRRVSGTMLRDHDEIGIGPFRLVFTEAPREGAREGDTPLFDDQFEILDKIGHGGMADVYRGRLTANGRDVAVKVPMLDCVDDTRQAVERFLRETSITRPMEHPNIISVISHGQLADGRPYMVMEYLPGGSLRTMMNPDRPLGEDVIRRVGAEVAAALGYAHKRGVVHRDIKPENVLFDEGGCAKLTDFGIALHEGYSRITKKGLQIGTAHYMSPEQIGGRRASVASDLYALGCVLYEMATGRCPFEGTAIDVMDAHLLTEPVPPSRLNSSLSPDVEQLVLKLLRKDPATRPRRADDVANALRRSRQATP